MELQKLLKTLHLRKVKNQTRSTIFFPTIARKVRVTGSILPNCSSYWKYFAEFNPRKHKGFEDKAACKLCFDKKKYKVGTIGRSGGSTSGLKRHLQSHHKKIYEELIGSKKATQMPSKMLVPYLERKKSPPTLGVEDMR